MSTSESNKRSSAWVSLITVKCSFHQLCSSVAENVRDSLNNWTKMLGQKIRGNSLVQWLRHSIWVVNILVHIMAQPVSETTECGALKQANEVEDGKDFWTPWKVSNTLHTSLVRSVMKRQQQNNTGLMLVYGRPRLKAPFLMWSQKEE